jgi:hypothetical protein
MAFDTYNVACRENVPGASKRHLAVWNGSSTHMVVVTLIRAVEASTAAAVGLKIAFGATRLTSIPTGGSALGWSKADTQQANMPVEIIALKENTAGSVSPDFFGACSLNPEETVAAADGIIYSAPLDMSRPLTLRQNEGFEVRQGALAGAGAVSFVATVYLLPVGTPV